METENIQKPDFDETKRKNIQSMMALNKRKVRNKLPIKKYDTLI